MWDNTELSRVVGLWMSEHRTVSSIVALVTPFLEDGSIDWASLSTLVDWHLRAGTHVLVVAGTTGEAATLSQNEYLDLVARVCAQVSGRIPVWAGTGSPCTAQVIADTHQVKALGADAALIVTPYYNRPTQRGLEAHYLAVAEAVDMPIVLYNLPVRTACNLLAETIVTLSAHPNIVGLKESSSDISRVSWLRSLVKPTFKIYAGDDGEAQGFMEAGADGVISVTANLFPEQLVEFCQYWSVRDRVGAEQVFRRLNPWHEALFIQTNPVPTKWALHQMGRISSPQVRLPMTALEAPGRAVLTRLVNTMERMICE